MKILLFLTIALLISSSSIAGDKVPNFTCYFWQPNEKVETIKLDSKSQKAEFELNDGLHQAIFWRAHWGVSIGIIRKADDEYVAASKSMGEVSYFHKGPRFSGSCYPE